METDMLRIHPRDNVAVALRDLPVGAALRGPDGPIELLDDIPFGHKIALARIEEGGRVLKYGYPIGHAVAPIPRGAWVHTHNLHTDLSDIQDYTYRPACAPLPARDDLCFDGYVRPDGRVGTRNEIWIVPTVGCVNATATRVAREAERRFAGRTDGIFAYTHNMGCSQMGEDQARTQRLLAGLIRNPNAGGVLVLSLGCENNNLEAFAPFLGDMDPNRVRFLTTQDVEDEDEAAVALIGELVAYAETFHRIAVPAARLTVGFKCGGSDAFSGITANALCGRVNDILCGCGAATMLTEVPEMFGAETILMNRCASERIFADTVRLINDFKRYYARYDQVIYENPSPGNKRGGITTLEEKSLGCIQKGGSAPVVGVLDYGCAPAEGGLHLLNGPGNDAIATTGLVASGATLVLFTTGRGNPLGAPVPTVKIASNNRLARHKRAWIDFSAGDILEGRDFDEVSKAFCAYLMDVASGRVRAKNEINGDREISLFRDGVIL